MTFKLRLYSDPPCSRHRWVSKRTAEVMDMWADEALGHSDEKGNRKGWTHPRDASEQLH
jgi:hypothetical protein